MYPLKQTTTWTCWRLWPLEESPAGLWTDTWRETDDRTPSMTIFCRALLAAVSGILTMEDVLGEVLGEVLVVVLVEHRGTDPEGEESVSYFLILVRTFKLLEYILNEYWIQCTKICINYLFKVILWNTFEMLNKTNKNIVWNFFNIDIEKLTFFFLCELEFNVSAISVRSRDLTILVLFDFKY